LFFSYYIIMELINALGLDWRILIAQLVNFAILIFVLWRFAYQPVFKILEERRLKVVKSLADSDLASQAKQEAIKEREAIIATARQEANLIITESREKAELKYQEIVDSSQEKVRQVIAEEKERIAHDKQLALEAVKKQTAELVGLALEKVLGEAMDAKKDQAVIERVIKGL
jgi:F-type H+-transporting ATPase subunit b